MTSACLDWPVPTRPPAIVRPDGAGLARRLRAGEAVVLLGHDARGDERCVLVADAGAVSADTVNAMARSGRGVIACAVDAALADRLGLSLIPATRRDGAPMFLRSVEAAVGVSTGISAADRATTLRAIAAPDAQAGDLVTPGHIMPNLVASGTRGAGTLHEAILPLLRAACQARAVAWCDVLDDDGEPAGHRFASVMAAREGIAAVAATTRPGDVPDGMARM